MKTLFTSTILALIILLLIFPGFSLQAQPKVSENFIDDEGVFQFSDETIRLLADAEYRDTTYPGEYNITQVPELLQKGNVLFALWTLINVYPDDQQKTRTVARLLTEKGIKGIHYMNAYYTYVFADPQIFHFAKGERGYMEHPQLLEEKLETCKTLIAYTEEYLKVKDSGE